MENKHRVKYTLYTQGQGEQLIYTHKSYIPTYTSHTYTNTRIYSDLKLLILGAMGPPRGPLATRWLAQNTIYIGIYM